MTSRLATLRAQLSGLRQARAGVRAATAWSALGTALIAALAALFVLDVTFELPVPQRLIVMLLAAGGVGWAFWRFTRPLLGQRETEIDMALLVERQQEIDSDLVAALQFEQPEARRWGSAQLESAVIDYVASVGRGINVFEGFSRRQILRRGGLLAAGVLVAIVAAILLPGHMRAFANRLLLGSMHYPTETQIQRIIVNQNAVLAAERGVVAGQRGMRPAALKAAQGRPLSFVVTAQGDLPAKGAIHVQLTGASRSKSTFEVRRLSDEEASQIGLRQRNAADTTAFYTGELPRLLDNVRYQLFLGDAWTDPASILMVPLPVVETRLTPQFPRYAQSGQEGFDPTARQVAVLEGTSIQLALESKNQKRLKTVKLSVRKAGETLHLDLQPQDQDQLVWLLPEAKSPLANIREEIRYEIQATDEDGLSLESPIRGTIRIKPDRPPGGLAEVVHKVVLPTATPLVEYRAADDYGLTRVALVAEIERQPADLLPSEPSSSQPPPAETPRPAAPAAGGGSVVAGEQTPAAAGDPAEPGSAPQPGSTPEPGSTASDMSMSPAAEVAAERHRFDIVAPAEPLIGSSPLIGKHALDLSKLKLQKGDRVKLTLEVTDYRGENQQGQPVGVAYASDPLVLEISDESGVLAAISEADQRSEERLTDIIKRQLGIGESP